MSEPSVNLLQDFAQHPDKWAAANKEHVANKLGTTVAELEDRIAKLTATVAPKESKLQELDWPDLPASCIPSSGFLTDVHKRYFGPEWCRAFTWLPLLAGASMFVQPADEKLEQQTNLFVAIVGESGDGKTQGPKRVERILRLKEVDKTVVTGFGSAEGMLEQIAERYRNGATVLFNPDELAHTMSKASIQGASFKSILNRLFYDSNVPITVSGRKLIRFNAYLSFVGGLVFDNFDEVYDASTMHGLYQRTMFTHTPTGYLLKFRPLQIEPLEIPGFAFPSLPYDGPNTDASNLIFKPPFTIPQTHDSVFDQRDELCEKEGIDLRLLEIVIRCARIFYAWDKKPEIVAADMEPFWELARYQTMMRERLKPNIGLNFHARADQEIRRLLGMLEPGKDGKWRDLKRKSKLLQKIGTPVANQTLYQMIKNGEVIEKLSAPVGGGTKTQWLRLRNSSDGE
jgi:hypothetical protein